jgi:hypothetical protein
MPKKPAADPSIEWADPPPRRDRTGKPLTDIQAQIATLKANPGQWAIVLTGAKRRDRATYLKRVGVEATSRQNDDGTFTIYARWNGGE